MIKQGREKPIRQQHPWIFSGAIASAQDAAPGDIVTVVAHDGTFLARGYWNPQSQIQVRILNWHDEPIDDGWWRRMLKRAIDGRAWYNDLRRRTAHDEGYRVVNAENDYLPGLIVDNYGGWLVLQALTLYIDLHKRNIVQWLVELFQDEGIEIKGVYERSDVDVRHKEGLEETTGVLWGEVPPDLIQMGVEKLIYWVDIKNGHKTGFYLDQKQNYHLLENLDNKNNLLDPETRLLNLFSYTGRFGLASAGYIVNVDASREILELAEKNYQQCGFPSDQVEFIQADVFQYLRDAANRGDEYDIVILDPPKFAHNKQQVEKAARGYKDINLNAFKLIKPGGYLMTFSCSGAVSTDLFQKIVFGALADSGRQAQIIQHLGASDDHPVALTFPEGAYLKGLLLRVY